MINLDYEDWQALIEAKKENSNYNSEETLSESDEPVDERIENRQNFGIDNEKNT